MRSHIIKSWSNLKYKFHKTYAKIWNFQRKLKWNYFIEDLCIFPGTDRHFDSPDGASGPGAAEHGRDGSAEHHQRVPRVERARLQRPSPILQHSAYG